MDAEQIGPAWDRLRHAQLVAAVHNSGRVEKKGGGLFHVEDFIPGDPWAPPPEPKPTRPPTLDEIRAAAVRAGMEL